MSSAATAAATEYGPSNPPPATRMWAVIQKLAQARDGYSRAKEADARRSLARVMADLSAQLRQLADAVVEEARG